MSKKTVAIIPARSGSKSIPHKNIKIFRDKPLIAHSILQACQLKDDGLLDDIFVSTDSHEYQIISEKWGARVPFLRPPEISGDNSTDYEFLKHFIDWKVNNEPDSLPDTIIQFRPTYPGRSYKIIRDIYQTFMNNYDNYDSLRTVVPIEKTPYKMYHMNGDHLIPIFKTGPNGINEPYNIGRQLLPPSYLHNGYLDIIKTDTILKKNSITGDSIYGYIMNENEIDDIDYESDWIRAEKVDMSLEINIEN